MIRTETTFRLEVDAIRDLTTFSTMQGVKNFSHKDDISKNRSFLTFILEDEGPVAEILSTITSQGKKVHSLQKSEPTLEDVFISMVGRGFECALGRCAAGTCAIASPPTCGSSSVH